MKRLFLLIIMSCIISVCDLSAKRVRYFFKSVYGYTNSSPKLKNPQFGTYVLELDTDWETVTLKMKANGSAKWQTAKYTIVDTDLGESIDGHKEVVSYTLTNRMSLLVERDNRTKKSTIKVEGGKSNLYFGVPYKSENF